MQMEMAWVGRFKPTVEGRTAEPRALRDDLDRITDVMQDFLLGETPLIDPMLSGSLVTGEVELFCIVDAATQEEGVHILNQALAGALEKAGVALPDALTEEIIQGEAPKMSAHWVRSQLALVD